MIVLLMFYECVWLFSHLPLIAFWYISFAITDIRNTLFWSRNKFLLKLNHQIKKYNFSLLTQKVMEFWSNENCNKLIFVYLLNCLMCTGLSRNFLDFANLLANIKKSLVWALADLLKLYFIMPKLNLKLSQRGKKICISMIFSCSCFA